MDQVRFERMVRRLERESTQSPGHYQFKVALLALLGFGILVLILGFAGAGLLLIAGAGIAMLASGGKAIILVLKLGKLLLLLAWPLWMLVKSSVSALFTRLPPPQGLPLLRTQAPALFDAMDHMRRRMKGPRFHHVLITDEVNAAVVQRPLFGLFGWPRNYLILGLPLLESMSPDEALAVVAHEYGHLAGSHSRFGAYIYRLRNTWGTIQHIAAQWQGWAGKPIQRIVAWYAPYFNAYTFVLARTNEYQADAASAELVGAQVMGSALKRVNVTGAHYSDFLERTFKDVGDTALPPVDLAARWASQAIRPLPSEQATQWLQQALSRSSQVDDTHPALHQRLKALPQHPGLIDDLPGDLQGPSAAVLWLGGHVDTLRQQLQEAWHQRVTDYWSEQHQAVQGQRLRLLELEALPSPTSEERIEALNLKIQLQPDTDPLPQLIAFNEEHPDHVLGLYLEGSQRLKQGDATGLQVLDRVMDLDADAIKPACGVAHGFCKERLDEAAAERYATRWRERDAWLQAKAQQLSHLDTSHVLRVPDGEEDAPLRAHGLGILRRDGAGLRRAYLVRRVLPVDPAQATYVLILELTWWSRQRKKHGQIVDRIAAHEWPGHVLICPLDGQFKPFKKQLKKLAGAEIRFK
ncbi:M48 family metallopeptidase [Aquabacterium sp. CECT 9606]|uniref:M48 family metallopeptidase n=1 Tax=Aquabacterium sp. CECT 9606 TaxID=2845822 RepID=UPI001E3F6D99|nr:M48 family metallopeptidase [Aquabacterium sp. CECT 9606]CAH0351006.1 Protease HtpX [Aquabacterium sp. CECT 9606]